MIFSNVGLAYLYDAHHLMKSCLSSKFQGKEALMASSHWNSPRSLWERIVLWATAIAEAAEMDTFGYLVGRIDHLEKRIATLESSDRGAASPKAQRD
jgi:transcriptional regulator of aromatic amino acid metabolism